MEKGQKHEVLVPEKTFGMSLPSVTSELMMSGIWVSGLFGNKIWCGQSQGLRHQTWLENQRLKTKVVLAIKQDIYNSFQYRKPHRLNPRGTIYSISQILKKVESLKLMNSGIVG